MTKLESYLHSQNLDTRKPFRCLSPMHDDKHPSMSYDSKRRRVKCFSCGVDYDLFGLIKATYGLIDDREVYKVLDTLFPENETIQYKPQSKKIKAVITDNKDFIKQVQGQIGDTDYFSKRGIDESIIKHYKLGYHNDYAVIPTSESTYVLRNTDTDANASQKERYRKSKGASYLFNGKCISQTQELIFIVEGELDALSFLTLGYEAIALGGTQGKQKLIDLVKATAPARPLLLALDNDDAGKAAQSDIALLLKSIDIPFQIVDIYGNYKDANDCLVANRVEFTQIIKKTISTIDTDEKQGEIEEQSNYAFNSAGMTLNTFLDEILQSANKEPKKTNFDALDDTLGGGLYSGLYVLGAMSSLGKTTFVIQIADELAKQGFDVLFFSLEMAKREIIPKSISRITHEKNERNAKTTLGILDGKRYFADVSSGYGGYSGDEINFIKSCIDEYQKYAGNIYIIESVGGVSSIDIREAVAKHKRLTDKTPIIFIDYLQLLAPSDIRATDKQTTDSNVMMLKQISRDYDTPVIAISSLNRSSYKDKISMSSFKESGSIEYSSDVLLGLQPNGEIDDIDEYKQQKIRDIELVVLKNRNGKTGGKIAFRFVPAFNHFEYDIAKNWSKSWT